MSGIKKISVEEEISEAMKKSKKTFQQETLDKLAPLLKMLDENCPPQPHLALTPVRVQSASVFASKLGGVPYLPKDMEYPTVLEGFSAGKPLKLLAQLNFSELPHLDGFPGKGILQFFAGCDGDDVYGVDFDDNFYQNGFRVIYHETIIEDTTKLLSAEEMPEFSDEDYPFAGEFLLRAGECRLSPAAPTDYRFGEAAAACYNALFDDNVTGMWAVRDGQKGICQVDKALYEALYEVRSASGTGIGGFPFFMQDDPRGCDADSQDCGILLFQLDSEFDIADENGVKGRDEIIWGDSGVANFFINAEDLARCDFSRVLYTWDCG